MVRPTKDEADRKTYMLRIRVTQNDRSTIEAAALSEGLDLSSWAREVLLRSARRKGSTVRAKWMRVDHGKMTTQDDTSNE